MWLGLRSTFPTALKKEFLPASLLYCAVSRMLQVMTTMWPLKEETGMREETGGNPVCPLKGDGGKLNLSADCVKAKTFLEQICSFI